MQAEAARGGDVAMRDGHARMTCVDGHRMADLAKSPCLGMWYSSVMMARGAAAVGLSSVGVGLLVVLSATARAHVRPDL